jgi:quercetin dioxygenase-like cupin family protein
MFFAFPAEWTQKESPHGYGPMHFIWGERVMAAIVTIPAGESVHGPHTHPHEQIGVVLEGEVEMAVGDKRRRLKKGDAYLAPPDVPHGRAAVSKDQIKLLEVFSPPREDLIQG